MVKTVDQVRVDKWLWSVRIFKSRTLAGEVCRQGHVKFKGKTLKPSAKINIGDILHVRRNGYDMQYQVITLIAKRVGAPIAETCYKNITPEEELRKFDHWYIGKGKSEIRDKGAGRPTKRQRREIDQFKAIDPEYDWGWIDEEDDLE